MGGTSVPHKRTMSRVFNFIKPLGLALHRSFASSSCTIQAGTEVEKQIANKLASAFSGARNIAVKDTSGGCGE